MLDRRIFLRALFLLGTVAIRDTRLPYLKRRRWLALIDAAGTWRWFARGSVGPHAAGEPQFCRSFVCAAA